MGRRWFSASTVANHISHGCHPSSLTALARACWKSLRWPRFLPLKLDPKGFCALKPHLLLIPDHVMSQLSPIMSHLASQDAPDWEKFLVRVRRVCSCPGRWGGGWGGMLWDPNDSLSHGLWMFSKTSSAAVLGCEVTPTPGQPPIGLRPWARCLNSWCLSSLNCQLSIIIAIL